VSEPGDALQPARGPIARMWHQRGMRTSETDPLRFACEHAARCIPREAPSDNEASDASRRSPLEVARGVTTMKLGSLCVDTDPRACAAARAGRA
jgi:hypothetical protein